MASEAHLHESSHPSPLRYVGIALVLAIVTLIEVAIVFVEPLRGLVLPILVVLSAFKFALVAMFFMHLRFDHRLFSILFTGGLILAIGVIAALVALFRAGVS